MHTANVDYVNKLRGPIWTATLQTVTNRTHSSTWTSTRHVFTKKQRPGPWHWGRGLRVMRHLEKKKEMMQSVCHTSTVFLLRPNIISRFQFRKNLGQNLKKSFYWKIKLLARHDLLSMNRLGSRTWKSTIDFDQRTCLVDIVVEGIGIRRHSLSVFIEYSMPLAVLITKNWFPDWNSMEYEDSVSHKLMLQFICSHLYSETTSQ